MSDSSDFVTRLENFLNQFDVGNNLSDHNQTTLYMKIFKLIEKYNCGDPNYISRLHENLHQMIYDANIDILFKLLDKLDKDILNQLILYDKTCDKDETLIAESTAVEEPEITVKLLKSGFVITDGQIFTCANSACKVGNVQVLDYMIKNNHSIDNYAYKTAIHNKHLNVIMWICDNFVPADFELLTLCATNTNYLEVLEYLKEKNLIKFNGRFYKIVGNNIQSWQIKNSTLEWLWNNGCKWTSDDAKSIGSVYMGKKFD
jgi:hypothetical protein